jgi:predicted membrane chloride channel (bestrophin family)
MTPHTQAAPAAGADARPDLGYFLDEDSYTRLMRAAAAAELMIGLGEYAELAGRPINVSPQQLGALGEYLQQDLRAVLAGCRFGRYDVAVQP